MVDQRYDALRQVKYAIRERYAWPGGYPIYTILGDGELLCPECARTHFRSIAWSTLYRVRDGWQAAGADILYETEGGPELCAHCGRILESAYGEVEA